MRAKEFARSQTNRTLRRRERTKEMGATREREAQDRDGEVAVKAAIESLEAYC